MHIKSFIFGVLCCLIGYTLSVLYPIEFNPTEKEQVVMCQIGEISFVKEVTSLERNNSEVYSVTTLDNLQVDVPVENCIVISKEVDGE